MWDGVFATYVTTSVVESRPGGEGVMVLGEIGVNEEKYAEVGSPITGRIGEVLVGIGDTVTQGQPLAVLESVELGKARAEVIAARARVELTQQSLARKRGLEGVAPRREVEEARAAAVAAAADFRAAEAGLRALGGDAADGVADTARFQVRAPLAGVVIDRDVARGRMVEPAHALFRVADLSRLWLTVHAFERDAVRVSPGVPAPRRASRWLRSLAGLSQGPWHSSAAGSIRVRARSPSGSISRTSTVSSGPVCRRTPGSRSVKAGRP